MSNTELRKACPTLNIELNVACPYCESYFNVLQEQITSSIGDHWTDAHEKLNEIIECPECHRDIHLEGVERG